MSADLVIQVTDLSKRFGKFVAVDRVSFEVRRGEVFGFLGLVFAVPAACIVKALLRVVWEWYVSEARLRGHAARPCVGVPYT